MRSVVLESLEELQEHRESWERLRLECKAPVFSSYDLVHLWLDNYKETVKPHIILIEDGGELVGAAPMCTNHARAMGLSIDSIAMAGNLIPLMGYSLYSVLAKDDDPEIVREMLRCVRRAKWNKLIMSEMETDISTVRFSNGIVQMWQGKSTPMNPAIDHTYVFPTEGNIAADFGKSTRGNLHRLRNKLEKDGRMDFRKVKSVGDAERAMDLYLSQHEERWGNKNSSLRKRDNRRFITELGKLAVRTGAGEISELLIDGEVAGQVLYYYDGDVARGIRVGMMDGFRDFSPGLMVMTLTMEDNRKRGLKAYDIGHGNEDYKLRLSNRQRALGSAKVFKGTLGLVSRARSFPPVRFLESRLKFQDGVIGHLNDR
jgi:hypothetical protein